MFGALLYLRLTSLRNLLLTRLKRLRQPKYLAGAVVGVAYFWFFFFRRLGQPPAHHRPANPVLDHLQTAGADWLPLLLVGATLVLVAAFFVMWLLPTGPAALGFTEAEIAFLFPAPMTRRALVHFKLSSGQFRSLFGAAVMALLSNRWTFLGGNAVTHAIGWWFVFSAVNLHLTGSSFTLTRLREGGLGVARRRLLIVIAVTLVVGVTVKQVPPVGVAPDLTAIAHWLARLAGTAPLAWLLLPARLVLAPFFAPDTAEFLRRLGPAALVIALHYFWVVRSVISFEEASIIKAEKRAERVAAWRSGERRFGSAPPKTGRPPPFPLPGPGRPELAFLWKNLLSTQSYFNLRTFLIGAGCTFAVCHWLGRDPNWRPLLTALGTFAMMFGGYLIFIGPQFARQDIRSDLTNADLLKTYPLAGWQVILGELLTPVAILTGLLWLLLLAVALALYPQHGDFRWLAPVGRFPAAVCLAVLAPALVTLQLLVPNAAALLLPAWFQSARRRDGGIDVMGQRLIFFFAQVVTTLVALLPAGLLAGLAAYAALWMLGPLPATITATVTLVAGLLAEIAGGLWWLGRHFENFDLSAELRP